MSFVPATTREHVDKYVRLIRDLTASIKFSPEEPELSDMQRARLVKLLGDVADCATAAQELLGKGPKLDFFERIGGQNG